MSENIDLEKYRIKGYIPTIGIECHVQLKTKTKLFGRQSNDARDKTPNTVTDDICFGYPGSLPKLNNEAVRLAILCGKALNTRAQKYSKFDRKHYFYPDLPKGYQTTQLENPVILGGYLDIIDDESGQKIRVNINRAHLEEDAGKSTHPDGAGYSLIDLNRTGTPLLEIVSEADMHSASQAKAYTKELFYSIYTSGASDCDLYQGNMRFDVNVSVSKDQTWGNRCEIKNLNSFRSVERATAYEIERQIKAIEAGDKIVQSTRGWDDDKLTTYQMRTKEDAMDYRYMPDPDIAPVILEDSYIDQVLADSRPNTNQLRSDLNSFGFDSSIVETIMSYDYLLELFLETHQKFSQNLKNILLWAVVTLNPLVMKGDLTPRKLASAATRLNDVAELVKAGKINASSAKSLVVIVLEDDDTIQSIAEKNNMIINIDNSLVDKEIDRIIAENQKIVDDIKAGKDKAIGALIGQLMKATKGQIDPKSAQEMIKAKLI